MAVVLIYENHPNIVLSEEFYVASCSQPQIIDQSSLIEIQASTSEEIAASIQDLYSLSERLFELSKRF
ncbi:hypothetical protein ASG85_09740 [Paenibacillus sp. Soil724D2]|nr:hypothetical protein ASG85_09740 [Paenibacillus sp. Soil724D2]